jgi:hypothetical protein
MKGRVVLAVIAAGLALWPLAVRAWSPKWQLTFMGLSLELIGVALVAIDFWFPVVIESTTHFFHRARAATTDAFKRARDAALLRLRRGKLVTAKGAGISVAFETNAAGEVTPGGRRPTPADLVRQLPIIEARLGELEARQANDAQDLRDRLDAVTGVVEDMIRRSKDQFLRWRMVGLVVAFAGAGVLAAANLVG